MAQIFTGKSGIVVVRNTDDRLERLVKMFRELTSSKFPFNKLELRYENNKSVGRSFLIYKTGKQVVKLQPTQTGYQVEYGEWENDNQGYRFVEGLDTNIPAEKFDLKTIVVQTAKILDHYMKKYRIN